MIDYSTRKKLVKLGLGSRRRCFVGMLEVLERACANACAVALRVELVMKGPSWTSLKLRAGRAHHRVRTRDQTQ